VLNKKSRAQYKGAPILGHFSRDSVQQIFFFCFFFLAYFYRALIVGSALKRPEDIRRKNILGKYVGYKEESQGRSDVIGHFQRIRRCSYRGHPL
jgi:hypothetical protein